MASADYEKLGVFYLGRLWDAALGRLSDEPLLYDARDLTTHAVCVGMTGSGKTGLGVALLEEAAIDGIPALIIDPKGDLGNLALTFPELRDADFQPWVDPAEAARQGLSVEALAARTAQAWRDGLADWQQDAARLARLRAAAEVVIYTPGSDAGRPLNVLHAFEPPDAAELADATALRDRVNGAVSALLGLLGVAADPLRSREHILLASLLDHAWRRGAGLSLAGLIAAVQQPPFAKVGVFDLDAFFPPADRLALALSLNNLLAAPGFDVWLRGEPLDVQRLLYTPEGRPRLAVLSIAHLAEAERMFFVTLLLNAVVSWMRRQPGTSSLRALLYMDEILGYFPPSAVPPSKPPMLTLLKQARAYGLGVVLATQNPVDLDYKGLANTGTWFIGRLQTERDKLRVLDGLEGVTAGAPLDRARMDALIAGLGSRTFLMRSVHEPQPLLFKSRWALSYLGGPMTPVQIRAVQPPVAAPAAPVASPMGPSAPPGAASPDGAPAGVPVRFLAPASVAREGLTWRPRLLGAVKLHFVAAAQDVDVWETRTLLAPLPDGGEVEPWAEAEPAGPLEQRLLQDAPAAGRFEALPDAAGRARNYDGWRKQLLTHAYQTFTLDLWACPALKRVSKPGEPEGDFRAALALALRERRDEAVETLRRRYAPRLAAAQDRVRRAEERIDREKGQLGQQRMQTAVSLGTTLLGALLGRRALSVGTVGRASSTLRGAGRMAREKEDVGRAEDGLEASRQQLAELGAEFARETARLQESLDAGGAEVRRETVRPRKADLSAGDVLLVWTPWRAAADGTLEPA